MKETATFNTLGAAERHARDVRCRMTLSGSWPMLFVVGEGRSVCPFETPSGPSVPRPTKAGQVRFTLQHRPVTLQSLAFPCSKKPLTHTSWVPSNTTYSVECAERASRRQRHLTGQRNRVLSRCHQGCRALNLLARGRISGFVGEAMFHTRGAQTRFSGCVSPLPVQ